MLFSPHISSYLTANPAISISLKLATMFFPTMQFCFAGGITTDIFHALYQNSFLILICMKPSEES